MSGRDDSDDHEDAGHSLLSGQRSRSAVVPARAFPDDPDTGKVSGSGGAKRIAGLTLLMVLVMAVVTLAESARGIVIPTLTLFNESLGGTQFFLSFMVGLFSVGRLFASIAFGTLLDRSPLPTRSPNETPKSEFRPALVLTLVVVILGHALYLGAAALRWLWLVAVSRSLTGFGTGVLAVARTVVAQWTSPSDRVTYMSWLSAVQYVGFAITPVIGSFAIDFTVLGVVHIDIFTFGSMLLLLVTSLVLVLFVFYWVSYPLPTDDTPYSPRSPHAATAARQAPATSAPVTAAASASASDAASGAAGPNPQPGESVFAAMVKAMEVGDEPAAAADASGVAQPRVTSINVASADSATAAATAGGAAASGKTSDSSDTASIVTVASAPSVSLAPLAPSSSGGSKAPIPVFTVLGIWELPGANTGMLWFFVLLNTVCRGTLSVAETYGAQVYMHVHSAGGAGGPLTGAALTAETEAVGRFFLYIGLIGVAAFRILPGVSRRYGEVATLNVGLAMLTLGFACLVDFDAFSGVWRMGSVRLWTGMVLMWSLGSSVVQIVVMSLFTKALQANPTTRNAQGSWIGWITAAGSIGRIVFPMFTGLFIGWVERGGVFLFVALVHAAISFAALRITPQMQPTAK